MRNFIVFISAFLLINGLHAQNSAPKTKVMTLGVFHFAYHNLDVVVTEKSDQISVLDEPFQSEIISICRAVEEFKPTILVVEVDPAEQPRTDSLYQLYKLNNYALKRGEVDQLAFRIGKDLGLTKIYCVNNWGKHYGKLDSIFADSLRMARFSDYAVSRNLEHAKQKRPKVKSIADELILLNNPERIKASLAFYLKEPFQYEETVGDFAGVDFETGRWFNRNLRIFRNIQRIPRTVDDRILLIFGCGHLNLLNPFIEVSEEFELVSPLPYLQEARKKE